MNRNPQYYKRRQKPLAVDRKNSHDEKDMQAYFEAYRHAIESHDITLLNV